MTSNRLYVGNLHYDLTEKDFQGMMEKHGPHRECFLVNSQATESSPRRTYGFVEFMDPQVAADVLKLTGTPDPIYSRRMIIRVANIRPRSNSHVS